MACPQGLLVFGGTMTRDNPQDEPADKPEGLGDPWAAFGYLVAGVAFYGLLGWGLGTWLHAIWLIPVGILVGAALGLYMVYARLGKIPKPTGGSSPTTPKGFAKPEGFTEPPSTTRPDDRPNRDRDDRGDTE
jgi:ATP synthase protein I